VPKFQIRLQINDDDKSSKQVKVTAASKVTINVVTIQRTLTESCNIMKRSNSIVFVLTAACAFAISSYATDTILVNDTWADGDRTSSGPDGSGIDSTWYSSSGAALTASTGSMLATIPSGSLLFLTYFAPDATPVTLASTGDELKITWTFTPLGLNANNTSQNFVLGTVDTPPAALVSADGFATAAGVYSGYSMYSNMGRTLGNGNPWLLKKWGGASSDFLGHQGNWTALINGATSGLHGYIDAQRIRWD
jgi:hypothetical protein